MFARRRTAGLRPIAVDLTPLIDMVFQLLAFFCMTLRIAVAEGDFTLALPARAIGSLSVSSLPPHRVQLTAGPRGELARVHLNEISLAGPQPLAELRQRLKRLAAQSGGAEQLEVVLACDPSLDYQHAMDAITAVSGERDAQGSITPLVTKLRLETLEPRE